MATEAKHFYEKMREYMSLLKTLLKKDVVEDCSQDTSPTSPHAASRSRYRETAEALAHECFGVDPVWLVDCHPQLWRRLVWLDDRADELERQGETREGYQCVLEQIVQTVNEIRDLYEQATCKEETVQ